MTDTPADMINHPPHYKGARFECIEVIEAYRLGYHLGNAFKYLVRHERKGAPQDDLKKALWYLERYLGNPQARAVQEGLWRSPFPLGFDGAVTRDVVASFGLPYRVGYAANDILHAAFTLESVGWIENARFALAELVREADAAEKDASK